MRSKTPPQAVEQATLEKLEEILEHHKRANFTDEELKIIRRMIQCWNSFQVLGVIGITIRNIVIWLGVMFGAYYAVTKWFIHLVKGV
jgi:hypothetical protein